MCFSQIGIFDTENTEAPPSPESRFRAIDGGETSPSGSSGLGGDTEIRPTGERHGAQGKYIKIRVLRPRAIRLLPRFREFRVEIG